MSTLLKTRPQFDTAADLIDRLGGIDPSRIRLKPRPGTATERDVIAAHDCIDKRLCELVDGVLVEKTMGIKEGFLALWIGHLLWEFLDKNDLGVALGADGFLKLKPKLVRIPDVSFIAWERIPNRFFPDDPIAHLIPDLAVEVISLGNTRREMRRKLEEYFAVGVRLVWYVYPKTRTVDVYKSFDEHHTLRNGQTLDGGEVLPGFRLTLRKLFSRLERL